jgi:hypothetical protein
LGSQLQATGRVCSGVLSTALKISNPSRARWYASVIPALRMLRREASLGYMTRPS